MCVIFCVVANNEVKMVCMHWHTGLIGVNQGDNNRRLMEQPVNSFEAVIVTIQPTFQSFLPHIAGAVTRISPLVNPTCRSHGTIAY